MPTRPQRPCRYPRCPELVDSGYCANHAELDKRADRWRGSAASRGYDANWRRFRIAYLRKHPLCVDCLAQQRVMAATEPHHVQKVRDRPDLMYDERNLMPLCKPCHQVRTARGE